MDINLHSFILMVGLIVITFIVVDGIKKVREARSNQFNDDPLDNDLLESDFDDGDQYGDQDESHFNDLEIADDLVSGSFVTEHSEDRLHMSTKNDADLDSGVESDIAQPEFNNEIESEYAYEQAPSNPLADPLQPSSDQLSTDDVTPEGEPSFESFSASDDNTTDFLEDELSSDSNTATLIKPETETLVKTHRHPRKQHASQPSKIEVENRRRELEQANEPEVSIYEPLLDVPKTVPVLMEPVQLGGEVDPNPPVQHEMHLPRFVRQTLQEEPVVAQQGEADADALGVDSFSVDDDDFTDNELTDDDVNGSSDSAIGHSQTRNINSLPVGEKLSERPVAQEVFVINVLKEDGPLLKGSELHHIFTACDMRHGEMDIFHRFEEENAQGKIQFSVVNALKPGTFDLNVIDTMETKGISLFMSLPGPEDAMGAFDAMAEVALVFARNFGASMYDESHSDLTPQTLEHYRNRIREYSRKQFSKK
jgi:cell division protein ZipA